MIASLREEFVRYKALAEAAIAQLSDDELAIGGNGDSNSTTRLVWHIAGNLESRFTEFRTSDGEKPWRDRDDEFETRVVARAELLARWEAGWRALFTALDTLGEADMAQTVTIRGQAFAIDAALHRSLGHTCYHVGQIVFLAKSIRADQWRCLSIPRGASRAFNAAKPDQRGSAHAARLREQT